jgi:hypothetical protein
MEEPNIARLNPATGTGWDKWARLAAGTSLLVMQVVFFVRARFVESRYFCWAPFHSEARYRIDATSGGRTLNDDEIARRYSLAHYYWDKGTRTDWELNTITHVIDTIRATEAALPAPERAAVTITYRVNGRQPEQWHSP